MLDEKDKYRSESLLSETLNQEPGYRLSDNFAENLGNKVAKKIAWKQFFREFLIYAGMFVGLAAVCAGIALIWYEADWKEWLQFIISNLSLVAGVSFLILFIVFSDKVLIPYFLFAKSAER